MVRPLASDVYKRQVWCDAEIEGKKQALNYEEKKMIY